MVLIISSIQASFATEIKEENGKIGLYAFNQKIIPPKYDGIRFLSSDLFIVSENDKYGLYYLNKQLIPPKYDEIRIISSKNNVFAVKQNDKYGLYVYDKQVIPTKLKEEQLKKAYIKVGGIFESDDYFAIVYDKIDIYFGNKLLFSSSSPNITTKNIGMFLVVESKGKSCVLGFEDQSAKEFDEIEVLSDFLGLFKVTKNDKVGVYQGTEQVIPVEFDYVTRLNGDYFMVKKNEKFGIYNYDKQIIPAKFDVITPVEDFYFVVKQNEKYGLYKNSKQLFKPEYDKIYITNSDIQCEKNGKVVKTIKIEER